jgi:hypothetical protein
MIISHFTALTIFALIVSAVFAGINKSGLREQLRYGAFVFFCFLAVAAVVGWIMYPFPF